MLDNDFNRPEDNVQNNSEDQNNHSSFSYNYPKENNAQSNGPDIEKPKKKKHVFTKVIAFAVCAGIIAACGLQYLAVAGICFTVTLIIAQYLKSQLGGLTGDTYGALTECGNVIYLLTAVFLLR